MTHTEKVHVIFGAIAALVGLLGLWSTWRPDSRARYAWPVLTFLIGFFLFIPVEAQTRTYQPLGWWETLGSFVPEHPETWLSDWPRYLTHRHVIQHKVGSFLVMLCGAVELARARGRLSAPAWGWLFPSLMLAVALAFGLHGGSAEHLPNRVEQLHHQVLGVLLTVAAISVFLVRAGRLQGVFWRGAWAGLVLVVGLDIALLYRLSPAERNASAEGHHHESTGPGMR